MPYYTFRDKETLETHTEFLTMSQLDEYKNTHPNEEQVFLTPVGIGEANRFGVGKVNAKPPSDFRDLLKNIKKSHHKSNTINDW